MRTSIEGDRPKISIIMGIYNCEETLGEAIDSILNQTYKNWQLIMCDDGSKDKTYRIAEQYKQVYPNKIILLKNSNNMRLASTLNRCLEYADGDYIARMDGDDISLPTRLEKQIEYLEKHKECDLIGTAMISFDEEGDKGVVDVCENPTKDMLRFGSPFCHATIVARKKVYDTLKGYRISKEIRRCEDVDLWFRFYAAGFKGANLREPLYRVREDREAFKRRSFSHGIDAARVSLHGYKMLNYPWYSYVLLLKPIIASALPGWFMKKYHNVKNQRRKG